MFTFQTNFVAIRVACKFLSLRCAHDSASRSKLVPKAFVVQRDVDSKFIRCTRILHQVPVSVCASNCQNSQMTPKHRRDFQHAFLLHNYFVQIENTL